MTENVEKWEIGQTSEKHDSGGGALGTVFMGKGGVVVNKLIVLIVCLSLGNITIASECIDIEGQLEKNECASLVLDTQDKKLNDVYKRLQRVLDIENKKKLKEAQLAWLTYKDIDCEQEGERYLNGSLYNYIINVCHTEKTNVRINELIRLKILRDEM